MWVRILQEALLARANLEGWPSGLRQQFAKLPSRETGSEGSNPSPSARAINSAVEYFLDTEEVTGSSPVSLIALRGKVLSQDYKLGRSVRHRRSNRLTSTSRG